MAFGLQNLTNKSRHKEIKHLLENDCIKKVEGPPNWVNPIIVLPISNDSIMVFLDMWHCVNSVRIRSFSGQHNCFYYTWRDKPIKTFSLWWKTSLLTISENYCAVYSRMSRDKIHCRWYSNLAIMSKINLKKVRC